MSVPRDVPDDPSGSREASDKFLSSYFAPKRSCPPTQRLQTSHQLLDPALKKILVGVLGDDGSIQECLASAFLQSIPDVVSQSLDDIDALSLPAFKKYLLKAFKGYVWWYQIYNGRLPPFASMTREKFDSFLSSHHWDPMSLFGVYIDEPEEHQLQDIPLQDFEISALQEPFFLQQILHHVLCAGQPFIWQSLLK